MHKDGYSYEEIAEILDKSIPKAIKEKRKGKKDIDAEVVKKVIAKYSNIEINEEDLNNISENIKKELNSKGIKKSYII